MKKKLSVHTLNNIKKHMISDLILKYPKACPTGNNEWNKSFTISDDKIYLWWNDENNSTHIVKKKI